MPIRAVRQPLSRLLLLGCASALVTAMSLTGCSAGGPSSAPASSAGSEPSATGPATAASTSSATNHSDKPSPDTLRPALANYFQDQEGLDPAEAQKAATCAMYPAFQELSAPSLKAIVKGQPSQIRSADEEVFGDVVTECETAAR